MKKFRIQMKINLSWYFRRWFLLLIRFLFFLKATQFKENSPGENFGIDLIPNLKQINPNCLFNLNESVNYRKKIFNLFEIFSGKRARFPLIFRSFLDGTPFMVNLHNFVTICVFCTVFEIF